MLTIIVGVALASFLYVLRWPQRGFALLLLLLPFTVALNPVSGIDLQLLRLLVPLFWLAVFIKHPQQFIAEAKKPQALLLWLFCALATLPTLSAQEPAWSVRKLLYLWSFAPLLPALLVIFRHSGMPKYKSKFLQTLFIGGATASLVGIAQFASQFFIGTDALFRFFAKLMPYTQGGDFGALIVQYPSWFVDIGGQTYLRAFAFFPDPHMLAFYLVMVSSLLLAVLLNVGTKKDFYLYAVCYMLHVLCLALTFSRGGYLGWLVSTAAVLGVSRLRHSRRAIALTALGIGMALFLLIVGAPIVGRFASSFNALEGSNTGRLEIWREALETFKTNPLGVGLGNYAAHTADGIGLRNSITAHNLYLDLLVETGIPGFAAFASLIVLALYALLCRCKKNNAAVALGALGALVGFSTHAFFENPLYAPAILTLWLVGVAVSAANP